MGLGLDLVYADLGKNFQDQDKIQGIYIQTFTIQLILNMTVFSLLNMCDKTCGS